MFQDPRRSLVPYWTIGRHLAEVMLRCEGMHDAEEVARTLLSQLGFRDPRRVLAAFPEQLSGGEVQRAMLALTMAMRPRLLIADEPTTGLDTINQARVLEELQRIHASSDLAIVLISHDLAVVERLVDHTYVFFSGRVLEHAPSAVLRDSDDDEIHPYTLELRESQRRRALGLSIVQSSGPAVPARGVVGCPYAARCVLRPRLGADLRSKCDTEFPRRHEMAPNHYVACWGMGS
jgi:ABC-type dipeptide/oligopeptide/nickel transport system ATPase component